MGNHTATRARGRAGGAVATTAPRDETARLRSEATALKRQSGREGPATPDSWLRQQADPTDPREALSRSGGSYQALFQRLADEPNGVLEAMAGHRTFFADPLTLPRGADRIEMARAIATHLAPPDQRAALEQTLLRTEVAMRQQRVDTRAAARTARPATPSARPSARERELERTVTRQQTRINQLERQLATLQAAHDALKAQRQGERASSGRTRASGWSEKNAAAARGAEPIPRSGPSLDQISPYGKTDASQLRDWYGADQLRSVLVRLPAGTLREALDTTLSRNPGTTAPSRASKDAMVNYLMQQLAPGY